MIRTYVEVEQDGLLVFAAGDWVIAIIWDKARERPTLVVSSEDSGGIQSRDSVADRKSLEAALVSSSRCGAKGPSRQIVRVVLSTLLA